MKIILSSIFAIMMLASNAQTSLVPGKRSFEKKWVQNQSYKMTWYAMKDTMKFEIAEIATQVLCDKKNITIVTAVNMKNAKAPWVDSTIANISTLKPVRHSSYNMQRDMVLNFGKIVTGFYNDKQKKQQHAINDTTTQEYFDSNLYPSLIAWLPLKEGYKQDISIYDYNPSGKIGVIKAFIKQVTSGIYESNQSGTRDIWVVTVSDEIGNDDKNIMTYYIDKADRKLWKQEINANGRKMIILLKEI